VRTVVRHGGAITSWQELFAEFYDYRWALFFWIRRRLIIRYRRSWLGFLWSFINPLLQMCVITLVYSLVFATGMRDAFPMVAVGLLAWNLMRNAVLEQSEVFLAHNDLIRKVRFSKLVLPSAAVSVHAIDFVLALLMLLVIFLVLGVPLQPVSPLVIVVVLLLAGMSWGMGLAVACLVARFRDIKHIVEVSFQLLFFATPIIYPFERIPDGWQFIYKLNPFWSYLLACRQILVEGIVPPLDVWMNCVILSLSFMWIGLTVYRYLERRLVHYL
jgi:lipopolysaccharide transport system permease protein